MRFHRGFSLLELLMVVAIILIIATTAVPALLRARQNANESAAVANLRTIGNAEANYIISSSGNYGTLPELVTAGLMDTRFGSLVGGYAFNIATAPGNYTAEALPAGTNAGRYGYFLLPDSVIRYATSTSATCA